MYTLIAPNARVLQSWLVIAALFWLTACAPRPSVVTPPSAPPPQTPTNLPGMPSPPASRAPAASPPTQAAPSPTVQPSAPLAPSVTPPADICAPLPAGGGIPRYRFDVAADPIAHRLQVKQQIALADRERLSTGEVLFNVPANHAAGTFLLANARLAGSPAPLPANLSGTTLRLGLPETARTAPEITICLDYTLNLPAAGGEGISAAHALGWSDLGMIAGYWHPVLAPHTKPRGWLLTPYHPGR